MKLQEMIFKEFVSVVEYLAQTIPVENGRLVIEREDFRVLLEKYAYLTFREKVKFYKQLNFVVHDKNNYTMPWKDPATNKTIRKVIINYETFETVKRLVETDVVL